MGCRSSKPFEDTTDEIRIAVVGRTGSGISQFIHDATGSYKHGVSNQTALRPFTTEITPILADIKGFSPSVKVVLIDTPGFDFTRGNSEHDKFSQLAKWVKHRYGSKARLDGVIYIHNIWTEELLNRPPLLTSDALEYICGPNWREKVVFVSSHWNERVRDDGNEREVLLKENYWSFMLAKGSQMTRYEEPERPEKAVEILRLLVGGLSNQKKELR
ncbi:hypothetical protein D9756_007104 [Leucocoprinus leucothites]|uniref:G domain-containing protein n=1 Tax=Leucocoprinus leucothites TaxID=201217 RepID=A0A8H5D7G6_9AGAR|nr:hypothetical protein D9756_007104 [Leucoagaricus leucothites]